MKATWKMGVQMWQSGWECKKLSEDMWNAENQCGNARNGVGMQRIRVELRRLWSGNET